MNEEKRKKARKTADRLRSKYEELNRPLEWFEELYKEADGDPELIPWGGHAKEGGRVKKGGHAKEGGRALEGGSEQEADLWAHGQARFPLIEWLRMPETQKWQASSTHPKSALDVGCGLGANAIALHEAGYQVTAFDISETAVKWAASQAPEHSIDWRCANLLDMPEEWEGKFDLVSETFTIQALYGAERLKAIEALTKLVAPKGKLLIICRGRRDDTIPNTPPLPLSPAELDKIETYGFTSTLRREYFDNKAEPNLHFLAEYTKT